MDQQGVGLWWSQLNLCEGDLKPRLVVGSLGLGSTLRLSPLGIEIEYQREKQKHARIEVYNKKGTGL